MSDDLAFDAEQAARGPRRQLLLATALFAGVVALLALGYFLFLRVDYVVLAQGMRPADAAAVVAELDKREIAYRLRDGGTTILVPQNQADATRVAIAGSDVAAHGQIGFELFNKSDMGLTNFAQKINYQRALQGELVRTIMAMEGVREARVHLALPERALFRGDRQEPKAAVTVAMKPGDTADAARVAGIQRLVAAAVPDLPEARVVVLDASGRVISRAVAAGDGSAAPADLEERIAVEAYYRARARGAAERLLPERKFTLRALVEPLEQSTPTDGAAAAAWAPSGEGPARNFRVRLSLTTPDRLNPGDRAALRNAIVQATGIDESLGDALEFAVGAVEHAPDGRAPDAAPSRPAAIVGPVASVVPPLRLSWPDPLLAIAMLLGGLLLAAWWFRSRRKPRLDAEDHESFAARLRRQLSLEEDRDAPA